ARQRDPHPPRAAEARSQGGPGEDPRIAAGSPGIPANRKGLRPPAGGAEVRPREGKSNPHAVPHLAEQDHWRAVRAPAERARLVPAPIGPPATVLGVTGPPGGGKGTLIRALLERFPGLELSVSATTRAPRPGEEEGR